jgi:hypothetical protein
VGGAALGGVLILVLVISFLVQPDEWVQIVLGVTLAAGATLFTWLFTSALRRSNQANPPRRPVPVGDRHEEPERPPKG